MRDKETDAKKHKRSAGKIIGATLGLGVLVLIIYGIAKNPTPATLQTDPNMVRVEDHVKGPTNAKATLIEYSDFQCPACAAYFPIVKQLQETFPQDLRVIYRHFPLTQIHNNAFDAARAAEAADLHGKFWEMHDILFAQELRLTGTPSFYLNGTKITPNPSGLDDFKTLIQTATQK